MSEKWTENQKKAIESTDKTLIISAGAGSGKTSVLTERIMKKLISGKNITDFLIVTFTRAAAADMRAKLYKKISAALADDKIADKAHIRNQLSNLPSAQIGTIDSFCLNIVRQNFHQLSLSPNVRTLDETDCKAMLTETINRQAERMLDADSPNDDFLLFYNNFHSRKDPDAFAESISKIYTTLRAQPFYFEMLDKKLGKLETESEKIKNGSVSDCTYFNDIKLRYEKEAKDILSQYTSLEELAQNNVKNEKYILAIEALKKAAEETISLFNAKFEDSFESAKQISFPSLPAIKDEASADARETIKQENTILKDKLKKIIDYLFSESREQIIADIEATLKIQRGLIDFLKNVEKEYLSKKRELGGIEFSDMEQMALSLLIKPCDNGFIETDYCKRLRNEYDEIFIDEYQDINPLQDMIFDAISKPNNRFMVGDVKQSIYRFRNAYPEIFERYKERAKDYPSDSDTNRIFLTRNFRCANGIIDFVNLIFERIYTTENVGTSYEKEKLIFSKVKSTCTKEPKIAIFFDERDDNDDEKSKREAEYVASEIIRLKSDHTTENGNALKYSDIALLFSSTKDVSITFENVLKSHNIPISSEKGVNLFECPEILVATSFLKVAENTTDDISLASVMRSPLFSFSSDDLYEIRRNDRNCSLYDSIASYAAMYKSKEKHAYHASKEIKAIKPSEKAQASNYSVSLLGRLRKRSEINTETASKCREFMIKLKEYRLKALSVPLHELVWSIYEDIGLSRAARATDDGENAYNRLMYFYDLVRRFESGVNVSLSYLNTYIDHLKSVGKTFVPQKGGEDAVKLMTVHSSKGLEFPVVFLCDASKKFNNEDSQSRVITNKNYGVCFKLSDEDGLRIKDTIIRKAAAAFERRQSKSEEARKLYVALTRPQELLYVTATLKTVKKKDFSACSSLLDMIYCALNEDDEKKYVCYPQYDEFSAQFLQSSVIKEKRNVGIDESFLKSIEYSYSHENISALPEKLSVSELRAGLLEDGEYGRKLKKADFRTVPEFISGQVSSSEVGTANHLFMQFADFSNAEKNGALTEATRLHNIGMISQKQLKAMSFNKIDKFFSSALYTKMKNSPKVYREKRFSISEPSCSFAKDADENEKVLVQGVIDCFFENDDGTFTVADYKTDRINHGEEQILKDRHQTQLMYYCRAVEAMTGKKVSAAYLYSFALNKEIKVL